MFDFSPSFYLTIIVLCLSFWGFALARVGAAKQPPELE